MTTRQRLEHTDYVVTDWEAVSCPICNSSDRQLYERFGDRRQYTYMLCRCCHLVYLTPRPKYTHHFIHDTYEFYTGGKDDRKHWDMAFLERTRIPFEQEVFEIRRYDRKRTALLDVGSHMGHFLHAARNHFDTIYGLDVSSQMASFIRRNLSIEVFTQPFDTFHTDLRFSCIRMSHVIEHVPDPHRFLQRAIALLAQDGLIVINVPNMFGLSNRFKLLLKHMKVRREKWASWRSPEHLYVPTIPSMLRLFQSNRCRVLAYYTYSRRDLTAASAWSRLYHARCCLGTKIRFYIRPHG